jgi:signal transduction histidine kinase
VPPPDTSAYAAAHATAGAGRDSPALAAAVLAAASGSHLESTLHDIVQAAVRHVDASYGAMGVLTEDGRRLDRFVIVGMEPEESDRIARMPAGVGILGLLVADPATLRLEDLTTHPASSGFPPGHPAMRSFLGVPVRVGDAVFGNLYLPEKRGGGPFTAADAEITQGLAAVAGLAIENARLAERAEARRRWGQAATELTTALLSGADPDEVLRAVSAQLLALADAETTGVLAQSLDDDTMLTIVVAVGSSAEEFEGVRLPLSGTHIGAAFRAGMPRLIDDIGSRPVAGRHAAVVAELTARYGPAMIASLGNGAHRGLLVALRRAGRPPFCPEELDLLSTFAAQASVVIELARAQQRERQLQLQADRDRIARDLHDHVVQRIFATALSLDRLSRSLEESAPDVAARIAARVDELDGTIIRIRSSIFELQETDDSTAAAVRARVGAVVRSITEGHDVRPALRIRSGAEELPAPLVTDVIAVVRELVTNVVRHAEASRVTVGVEVGDVVRVVVTDDGRGLPPITVRSGLANLADRADRRGGRLTVNTGESGTEVCWAVPLSRAG